jgi:hypothetical protein
MLTALAGPTVNVLICMVCTAVLIGWSGSLGAVPWHPLRPMTPVDPGIHVSVGQAWWIRLFGLSYFLLLVNLLPVLPFDGGRVLRTWLWPRMGYAAAAEIAAGTGMAAAVLVGLSVLFVEPGWLPLMIAVVGYLACYHARRVLHTSDESDRTEGRDDIGPRVGREPKGGTHSGRNLSVLERRRAHKAHHRAEDERRQREQHARAVEAVLRKISASGLASLTPEERSILEAETERRRAESGEASNQVRHSNTDDRTSGRRGSVR